jgi:GNAT superfamily N-acetyltransferase
MRSLAAFEGYLDGFRVTEADIVEHGLGADPRFGVLVAGTGTELVGIAVHYAIPWTFDMKPIIVLKELYVVEPARGSGAGRALFEAVVDHAKGVGASAVRWIVLPENDGAKRFYDASGGSRDIAWEPWKLALPG